MSYSQLFSYIRRRTASFLVLALVMIGPPLLALRPALAQNPMISSALPLAGPPGTVVTITGTNLAGTSVNPFGAVEVNTAVATVSQRSDTSIVFTVPAAATTGPIKVLYGMGVAITSIFIVTTAPVIQSFTPTHGPGGTVVTITGSGFTGTSAVSFNGTAAASFAVSGDTLLTAVVPSGITPAAGPISVTNIAGTFTSAQNFTVDPPIVLESLTFSPSSVLPGHTSVATITLMSPAPANGTINVTASSSDVIPFDGFPVPVSAGDTTETLTLTGENQTTNNTPVTVTVTATVVVGTTNESTVTGTIVSLPDPPSVTSFTPTLGLPGTVVTITGNIFTGATGVAFGGAAAQFTIVGDGTITATVPTGAQTGKVSVTGGGGSVAQSSGNFTVLAYPILSTLTFSQPAVGTGGATTPVTGTVTFAAASQGATTISLSGNPAAAIKLLSTIPINTGDTSETFPVVGGHVTALTSVMVTAGVPGSSAHASINVVPLLAVTSISPTSGPVGTVVKIIGMGLTLAASVTFGGITAPFTIASDTEIDVTVPTGATTNRFVVHVPVSSSALTAVFTVTVPPAILMFTPTSGVIGASVALTGTAFTGATKVTFNGVSATYVVVDATTIATSVPLGATTGPIGVITPMGSATSASNFTVLSPQIVSFTPASGTAGTVVTITGSAFTGTTAVTVNGIPVPFHVVNDTTITFTVPLGLGTGDIEIVTPYGAVSSMTAFTTLFWSAKSVAAAPDGSARILWTRSDGAAGIWIMNGANAQVLSGPVYGPFTDSHGTWTAKIVKTAPDGSSRLLWTRSDGAAGVWSLNASGGSPIYGATYGPISDSHGVWSATGLAVAADGTSRLLWTRSDGAAGLWSLNTADVQSKVGTVSGPYASSHGNWTAVSVSAADSGSARVLWTNPGGAAGLWSYDANDLPSLIGPSYGPYNDGLGHLWSALAVGSSTDGTAHVLWALPTGVAGLWTFDAADQNIQIGVTYGPFAGFSPISLDTANDQSRVLWSDTDLASGLWTFNAGDTQTLIGHLYGPF